MSLSQQYKREYRAWNMAKNACLDKDNKKYKLYGGRGVSFCLEWVEFGYFLKDMGKMPENCDGLILSDKSKGYDKFNCTWGKVTRGMKPSTKKEKGVKTKKKLIKDSMSFCLTLNQDHYAYIKRQAIQRSQQTGDICTANDLIRETLIKAFPYSGQYDMFGGSKL